MARCADQLGAHKLTAKFQIVFLLLSIVLAGGLIELMRRGHLRGKYTVVWVATCLAFLALALFPEVINGLAKALGVIYPPNALFMVAIVCIVLILVEFSAIATRLHRLNRDLVKKLALLTWRVEQLEAERKETERRAR